MARIIHKVKFVDKWVEIWFQGKNQDSEMFHESEKAYRLINAASMSGLYDDIASNGYNGIKYEINKGVITLSTPSKEEVFKPKPFKLNRPSKIKR